MLSCNLYLASKPRLRVSHIAKSVTMPLIQRIVATSVLNRFLHLALRQCIWLVANNIQSQKHMHLGIYTQKHIYTTMPYFLSTTSVYDVHLLFG